MAALGRRRALGLRPVPAMPSRPSGFDPSRLRSKVAILAAVGAFPPSHAARLAKLKKADIASEVERLAEGTGWMPAVFAGRAEAEDDEAAPVATEPEAEVEAACGEGDEAQMEDAAEPLTA